MSDILYGHRSIYSNTGDVVSSETSPSWTCINVNPMSYKRNRRKWRHGEGTLDRRRVIRNLFSYGVMLPGIIPIGFQNTMDPAILDLKNFLNSVIGQDVSLRMELAGRKLSQTNPLDDSTILSEIASIGVLVRASNTKDIIENKYISRSLSSIEAGTQSFPDNPWLCALHGAWHFEVARRSTLAGVLLNASTGKGRDLFVKSMRLDPSDAGLNLCFAISLLSDQPADNAAEALDALKAARLQDGDDYSRTVAHHSRHLLSLLEQRTAREAGSYCLDIF